MPPVLNPHFFTPKNKGDVGSKIDQNLGVLYQTQVLQFS